MCRPSRLLRHVCTASTPTRARRRPLNVLCGAGCARVAKQTATSNSLEVLVLSDMLPGMTWTTCTSTACSRASPQQADRLTPRTTQNVPRSAAGGCRGSGHVAKQTARTNSLDLLVLSSMIPFMTLTTCTNTACSGASPQPADRLTQRSTQNVQRSRGWVSGRCTCGEADGWIYMFGGVSPVQHDQRFIQCSYVCLCVSLSRTPRTRAHRHQRATLQRPVM